MAIAIVLLLASGLATLFAYRQAFPPRDLADSGSVAVIVNGAGGPYQISTFAQVRIPDSDEPSGLSITIEATTGALGQNFELFVLFQGALGQHLQGCDRIVNDRNEVESTLQPTENASGKANELLRSWTYQGTFLQAHEPIATVMSVMPSEAAFVSTVKLWCGFDQEAIWARNLGDPAAVIPSTTVVAQVLPALTRITPPRGSIENYTFDYAGGIEVKSTDSGLSWTSEDGAEASVIYPHGRGSGKQGYQHAFVGQQYFRFKDDYASSRESQWSVLLGLMLALTVQAAAHVFRLRFPSHFPERM